MTAPAAAPSANPGGATIVEHCTGETAFGALLRGWPQPLRATGHSAVFGAAGWFEAACRWQPPGSTIGALGVRRGERLVAVLPFVDRVVQRFGVAIRERASLAVPDAQACDVIMAETATRDDVAAIASSLAHAASHWDVLRLRLLPPASQANVLHETLARNGFAASMFESTGNAYIDLAGDWTSFYAGRSRRLKKASNLAANRLARAGRVDIDWLAPGTGAATEVDRMLAEVIAISSRSWKQNTGNSLDRTGPRAFIEPLTRWAHAAGLLSIWVLRLDGRVVATEYQLVADGDIYALRSDFDAAFEPLSPGSHLSRTMLERLFGGGYRRYYMGPGANPYKLRWADAHEPVGELVVWGRSARGRALAQWERHLKPFAKRVRDRLRSRSAQGGDDDAGPPA